MSRSDLSFAGLTPIDNMGYQTKRRTQMNHYETLFVVKPTLTDEEIKAQIEKNISIITKEGGEVVAIDDMGMRKLAYPVEKNERGYYTVVYHKSPGTLIAELERQMRYNEEVIKFMTVRFVNKKEIAEFTKMANNAAKKQTATKDEIKTEAESEPETVAAEAATEA
jgi:small subunit ribosomal protein S6